MFHMRTCLPAHVCLHACHILAKLAHFSEWKIMQACIFHGNNLGLVHQYSGENTGSWPRLNCRKTATFASRKYNWPRTPDTQIRKISIKVAWLVLRKRKKTLCTSFTLTNNQTLTRCIFYYHILAVIRAPPICSASLSSGHLSISNLV